MTNKKDQVGSFGDKPKNSKKKIDAPVTNKYWNADYLIGVVYRNGGLLPGGAGNVMKPEFYGCGIEQDEFLLLLTFYGAFMFCAKKDPKEAETIMEEIGRNLISNYKLDEDERKWIDEKFIQKNHAMP